MIFVRELFSKIKKEHIFYLLLGLYVLGLLSLSIFRDMVNDETLYFHETYLISQLFRNGSWIGAYGVGIHGFLFKLPPAIIFLITGPSVAVVTSYHIILVALVAIVSFKLFSFVLKDKAYGILSTIILLSNFHFLISSTTYLREIPVLLVVLLLLNHMVRKRNQITLSFLFLLLLDVKEYVFVIFAVFYVIWLFIDSNEKKFLLKIWYVLKHSFITFLPSFIWLLLMFLTHIIPINMFVASLVGLKDNTFGYLLSHFDVETSTNNALEGGRSMLFIQISDTWHPTVIFASKFINTLLSYIGKVMYPRVFSFLSVPKVVVLPVVVSALLILKRFIIGKEKELRTMALFSTLILTWLTVYILRASHGRYLLPIVPAIGVVFVYFLFKQKLTTKQKKIIFIATVLYVSTGVYFETSYVIPKILLEYGILTLLLTIFLKPFLRGIRYLLIILLVAGSMSAAILFSYVQGQIYGYKNFGRNRNAYEISQLLPEDSRYWINSPRNHALISVYNKETYLDPEWKWKMHEVVNIRETLKVYGEKQSFTFPVISMGHFRENIRKFEIEDIFLIVTKVDRESYPDQEYLDIFLSESWLEFQEKVEYKGMDIYILRVLE